MTSKLASYAKAAQHLRMAWLTQTEFPAKAIVEDASRDAIAELPEATTYEDNLVRSALQSIVDGADPRGGTFKAQAIYAAAQLHDRVTALALEPKVKKAKVGVGSVLHGYCGGLLGDSYGHRVVTVATKDRTGYFHADGDFKGSLGGVYEGDPADLSDYLVPDTTHCTDNCTPWRD